MFYITARGRTGTTMLATMLNAHSEIAVPNEGLFMLNLYHKYRKIKYWDLILIQRYVDDIFAEEYMQGWKIDPKDLTEYLQTMPKNSSYREVNEAVYRFYALSQNKSDSALLGDKNPTYALLIDEILCIDPDAKFIHLVRDYRDNVLSYQQVQFDLRTTAPLAYRWRRFNVQIEKHKAAHPEKFLFVRYEDMVENPQKELSRICNFLTVTFEEEMLNFYQKQENLPNYHQNLKNPPNKKNIKKWKKQMVNWDILICDSICGELGESYGYTRHYKVSRQFFSFKKLWGRIYGWIFTRFERVAIRFFPVRFVAWNINRFRKEKAG